MSYYLEVIKDTPYSLIMHDTNTAVDGSGYEHSAASIGVNGIGAPLVSGVTRSAKMAEGIYHAYQFPYMKPATERQPVSVECWFVPTNESSAIASHLGSEDGLFWDAVNKEFRFSIKLATSGYVGVSYAPSILGKVHLVGVYTGTTLMLYVNGEIVGSRILTELEQKEAIVLSDPDERFWSGNSYGFYQALAFYEYALSPDKIVKHYLIGNDTSPSVAVASIYKGKHIEIDQTTANIFNQKNWTEWTKGFTDAVASDTGVVGALDPSDGTYMVSSWQDTFELEQGGTSIESVQIEYDIEGDVVIETSMDNGISWSPTINTKRIAGIESGDDPTDKTIVVRATFGEEYGRLKALRLTGLTDLSISSQATLPIVLPDDSIIKPAAELNRMTINMGVEIPASNIVIGPNTDEDAVGYKSINFWYYCDGGTRTTDFTGTFYENAISMSSQTIQRGWTMVTITNPTPETSSINLGGTNITYAYITLYQDELTAEQIADLLRAYTGKVTRTGPTTDSLATIADQSASIYASDWSISPVG